MPRFDKIAASLVAAFAVLMTFVAHAQAGDLLVSSRFSNNILRYTSTGAFVGVFASCNNPNGIVYGPDGNLYVALGDEPRILKLDGQTGALISEFVNPSTPGGLASPRAIAFGPDGNLYVCSGASDQVLAYSGATGAFLRVAAGGQGLDGPVGLTFGPEGNLYVGGALSNRAYAFAPDGTFLRSFACPSGASHLGMVVDKQGRLLVARSGSNIVLAYDPGTGGCLGVVAQGNGLSLPIYLTLEADGNLLVGSFNNSAVLRFDPVSTQFLGVVVPSSAGGLSGTHTVVHMPDAPVPARPEHWGTLKVRYR